MLNIYLTRHGQDEDNKIGVLNGHRDTALTELGLDQARQLAFQIKESGLVFDTIYSSPLSRTYKTAKIIATELGLSDPILDDNLIERDFGDMTGRKISEALDIYVNDLFKTEIVTYILSFKGGEDFPELIERAKTLLAEINKKHQDGNILLVTHGDFGKMIYAAYYDLDWKDVLSLFHFGNSDLVLLSPGTSATHTHVFKNKQFNL